MEYRFIIEDQTAQGGIVDSGTNNMFGVGSDENANTSIGNQSKTFTDGAMQRAERTALNKAVAGPLNQATGGLAQPFIRLGTSSIMKGKLPTGAALGGAFVGAAIIGVMAAISAIEARVKKNEEKANNLNEIDNVRLRAGSVRQASFYSGNFWGVKSKTNRS